MRWMLHAFGLGIAFLAGSAFLLALIGLGEARGFGGMFIFPLVAVVAIPVLFGYEFWKHSETDRADYRLTLYAAAFSAPAVVLIGSFLIGEVTG